MGLPLAFVDEAHGGLGLDQKTAFELVRMCGRHVLAHPIVETMLANHFSVTAGGALCDGPVHSLGKLTRMQQELAALARAMQMAGALETILAMTISHVEERSQFGRPIAKFQAVQHSLALLASEVAAATAAADHAVGRFEEDADTATLAIGIARARIGEACSKVSALAHQLHGAIGYTREHRLHHFTTAVWKWRDEFGTQSWWTRRVGQMVLANGRGEFWPMVTSA
ncbi:acyl-CoA dehydrogenase [Hyphomonas johnsonii MHS-2]|uniref:Acyl-CoA dehydrogenase n=2 Tax=Hyphomonas johnsonii TaxID=81031 RepID=A0A059FN76_9PROT|nr:acyl-CoA dehydrogenase [Hyphomonas johnsonii MHS-2]